jgi:hypothetical protein
MPNKSGAHRVRDHMLTAVMQTKYRAAIAEESNSSRTTGNADAG